MVRSVRHRLNIARMSYRLEFGHAVDSGKINPNTGNAIKKFKPELMRWGAPWGISEARQLALAGAGIKDAVEFAIRHDESITSDYLIRNQDKVYTIDSIQYDQTQSSDGYDIITCHRNRVKHN